MLCSIAFVCMLMSGLRLSNLNKETTYLLTYLLISLEWTTTLHSSWKDRRRWKRTGTKSESLSTTHTTFDVFRRVW